MLTCFGIRYDTAARGRRPMPVSHSTERQMKVTRLHMNDDGRLLFERVELPREQVGPELVTYLSATGTVEISETAPGHDFGWHHAPQKQYVITLQGAIEVELPDGTRAVFAAGSILIAENTTGQEHATRVVSHEPWRCVYVPVG